MRRRSSKITVSNAAGLAHGVVLAIGTGDDMELVRVRWSWRRRVLRWLRARTAAIGWYLRRGLCAAAGHRVNLDTSTGLSHSCHCWCRRRWEDDAERRGLRLRR